MKRSSYVIGAGAIALTLVAGFLIAIYFGRATEIPIEPLEFKQGYCLFTWKKRSDDLCFAFMPKYKSLTFMKNPFGKYAGRCGISHLEEDLSALPPGTYVEWNNWPPKFIYPDGATVAHLIQFAKAKNIELKFNPIMDAPIFPE